MLSKRSLVPAILAAAALLTTLGGPALAAQREPVGDRILIFGGDAYQQYPAGAAFNIRHGVIVGAGYDTFLGGPQGALGRDLFTLDVDGVPQKLSYSYVGSTDPEIIHHVWVFNFPNGMTGVHTFTGHWFLACGFDPDLPCNGSPPTTPVEYDTESVTVTFTTN